ncbi:prepilin-type N-terminal cleavage/methylation domain-containing protein [Candidatus Kaiserbacteria bacterium]|nr:prepilin-type N-terminal cleavage/methylation domain-containing protein [Candidatus Kaiserbacteria bacterium]
MDLIYVRSSFRTRAARGFTLIELLVVTAILSIISGIILINNNKFGGAILLSNLAYDVGLSIREAQVYGIAVRRYGTSNFTVGYGMHFSKSSPTTYVLFADAYSVNGLYDGCPDTLSCELVESTDIHRGFHILDLCALPGGGGAEICGLDRLDILFKRPEPDAFISANGVSGVANPAALQERGRIVLESPRGDQASVVVEVAGQIATQ